MSIVIILFCVSVKKLKATKFRHIMIAVTEAYQLIIYDNF